MWNWIKRLFGWKPPCRLHEGDKLRKCLEIGGSKRQLKAQMNKFCKAVKK